MIETYIDDTPDVGIKTVVDRIHFAEIFPADRAFIIESTFSEREKVPPYHGVGHKEQEQAGAKNKTDEQPDIGVVKTFANLPVDQRKQADDGDVDKNVVIGEDNLDRNRDDQEYEHGVEASMFPLALNHGEDGHDKIKSCGDKPA